MIPLSCVNCCFNGLQYDTVGTSFGYCTEHRKILHAPSALTCGRLLRKDLLLPSAQREQALHEQRYTPSAICSLRSKKAVNGEVTSGSESDLDILVLFDGPVALGRDLKLIVWALYPLQMELDRIIEAYPVTVEVFEAGEFGLYRSAKREGIRG